MYYVFNYNYFIYTYTETFAQIRFLRAGVTANPVVSPYPYKEKKMNDFVEV
jgi:hypothetical protein